jgi:hypothetical protein
MDTGQAYLFGFKNSVINFSAKITQKNVLDFASFSTEKNVQTFIFTVCIK